MICVNKMKIEEKKCSIKYNFPPLKNSITGRRPTDGLTEGSYTSDNKPSLACINLGHLILLFYFN